MTFEDEIIEYLTHEIENPGEVSSQEIFIINVPPDKAEELHEWMKWWWGLSREERARRVEGYEWEI